MVRTTDQKLARAERLVTLLDHPNWQELRDVARERRESAFRRLANQLVSPTGINESERHFTRGFFAGMEFLLRQPGMAQKEIDRALSEALQADER